MADGRRIAFDVWEVTVLWDGAALSVETDEADTTPMAVKLLLDTHSLYVEAADAVAQSYR